MTRARDAATIGRSVCRRPLGARSAAFRAWTLRQPAPDIAELRPTLQTRVFWLAFGMPGLAALLGAPGILDGQRRGVLPVAIACAFAVAGLAGIVATSGRVRLTADRLCQRLVIRTGAALRHRERTVWLQDVAALQICAGSPADASGSAGHRTYELNLVLKDPPCERIHLVSHANLRCLRRDAEEFASFLAVPLFDHADA